MSLRYCFEKGLLKKATLTDGMVDSELGLAEENLQEAASLNDSNHLKAAVLFVYTSMFHSARALLHKDGYTERSHSCLNLYLIEKYVNAGKLEAKFTNALDELRADRHQALYGSPKIYEEEDVDDYLALAEEFLGKVKALVEG